MKHELIFMLKNMQVVKQGLCSLLRYNQPFKGCLNNGHLNYWKTLQNEKKSTWFFHGPKTAWKTTFISHIEHHRQQSNKITTKIGVRKYNHGAKGCFPCQNTHNPLMFNNQHKSN